MVSVELHKIVDFKKLKKPTVIIGFPGTGLVGSVAASQIVDSLQMPVAGYFSSPDFAPLAAIHNFKPLPAARIHYSEKYNLVVLISEMTIPVGASAALADVVYDFATSLNASSVISLGGIALKENSGEVYVISSDPESTKDISAKKFAKPIKEGATTGVVGILLTRGALESFPITAILAEASEEYLDPKAAANAIRTFSNLTGIQVSTARLEKEAVEVSKTIKEAVIKARITKKRGPGTEEGGSMYG